MFVIQNQKLMPFSSPVLHDDSCEPPDNRVVVESGEMWVMLWDALKKKKASDCW